jgi:DNA-binding NarL/FixJ family response regulator
LDDSVEQALHGSPDKGSDEGRLLIETELTVLLADDQVTARIGIRRAIEPHRLRVVAEVGTAAEALRLAIEQQPDVCVLSVALPGNAIEATREIKQSLPATKIVMLAASWRDEDLFAALRAGADGYLLMTTSPSRLPHAIRGVARGEAALPRELTARLIREFRERGHPHRLSLSLTAPAIELTAREFEVLERLRKREPTAEMAGGLGISDVTIRRHVSSLLQKFGAPNRSSVVEMVEEAERQRTLADGGVG